jgi:hypothetical protein
MFFMYVGVAYVFMCVQGFVRVCVYVYTCVCMCMYVLCEYVLHAVWLCVFMAAIGSFSTFIFFHLIHSSRKRA